MVDRLVSLSLAIGNKHERVVLRLLRALRHSVTERASPVIFELMDFARQRKLGSFSSEVTTEFENIIVHLLQSSSSTTMLQESIIEALWHRTAEAKLVGSIRYLIDLRLQIHVWRTDYLDAALFAVLRVSACEGDIRQSKLLEVDYKIVEMLVSMGLILMPFRIHSVRDKVPRLGILCQGTRT